jgi:ATP-dependent exoDNAse (exonuclease V) beta subunit
MRRRIPRILWSLGPDGIPALRRRVHRAQGVVRPIQARRALLDFDDLLHHARNLLATCEPVRQALARRYPRILVDEFQDTDPLQAEILWRLAGEGIPSLPWQERQIRPGALFLVGDPKQAIYRFRGADVATYLAAKNAMAVRDPASILEISANFRSQAPILEFVNQNFAGMLDVAQGQPGFVALAPVRQAGDRPAVATFEIAVEDRHKGDRGLIVDELRREEAGIVAGIVQRLIGSYPVWDKDRRAFREARAGDIALLAPTGPACGSMSGRWKAAPSQSPPRRARDSSTARKSKT